MSMETIISGGMLMQVAYSVLADKRKREVLGARAPITALLCTVYSAAAAAAAASSMQAKAISLVEDAQLMREPWRLVTGFLVYHRLAALAFHLWLLLKVGPPVEIRLGSQKFALLFGFGASGALALRACLLEAQHRPALLTAAPLFTLLIAHSRTMPRAPDGDSSRLPTVALPWLVLTAIACLDGVASAVPGMLGCGAGSIFEAVAGLPPPEAPAPAAPTANGTDSGAAAGGTEAGGRGAANASGAGAEGAGKGDEQQACDTSGAAALKPAPSMWSRALQVAALAYLIASLGAPFADTTAADAQQQCRCAPSMPMRAAHLRPP